jgi:hypothetical protein
MNPFLKSKIRQMTQKKQKKLYFGRNLSTFDEDPE